MPRRGERREAARIKWPRPAACPPPWPRPGRKRVTVRVKTAFKDRRDGHPQCRPHHAVPDRGDAQRSLLIRYRSPLTGLPAGQSVSACVSYGLSGSPRCSPPRRAATRLLQVLSPDAPELAGVSHSRGCWRFAAHWPALAESGGQRDGNGGRQGQCCALVLFSPLTLLCPRPRRCLTTYRWR